MVSLSELSTMFDILSLTTTSYLRTTLSGQMSSIACLQELKFNDRTIGPLCLPMRSYPSADFMNRYAVTVQGWGRDNFGQQGVSLTQVNTIRIFMMNK